jgi:ABC-2 type transport system permease protein
MFPIFLATLFHFAFSNLMSAEVFEKVDAGILLSDKLEEEKTFLQFSENNDYYDITEYEDENKAKKDLNNGKIKGYYKYDDKLTLIIKENGYSQTILDSKLTGYLQTYKFIENTYKETGNFNPDVLNIRENHIIEDINKKSDLAVSFFYTIIAMSALYAAFNAIYALSTTEANLSKVGARFSVGPTHKMKILFINIISATIFNMVAITLLFIYLKFILGVDFGENALAAYLISLVGCVTGIALGLLVSSIIKGSENFKNGIVSVIVMSMSGLAGMFSNAIKMWIDNEFPVINKYNPAALITDCMNYLYRYNEIVWANIYRLIGITLVLFFISYMFIRRKKYDSI